MKSIQNICYAPDTGLCLDIHLPECDTFPVLVYLHGGGLESGHKAEFDDFFACVTARGIAVVSADYRLYPAAKYPDFLCDAAQAVAWTLQHMPEYGRITATYVSGSSAGGYLTQMLCFDKRWLGAHGIVPTDITAFIHDAGQPTCHFNVLRERGIDSRRVMVDDSCALYHVGEDEHYPPMLIIVSDNDMENRYEQTMLLVSTLKHFGHTENIRLQVMHGTHCSYIWETDAQGDNVLGKLCAQYILGE